MNLNRRIKNKKTKHQTGLTKPQLKRIRSLMNQNKYHEFIDNWNWWDFAYIMDLLYYVDETKDKAFLSRLEELEDNFDGILIFNSSEDRYTLLNRLWEAQKPYFELVRHLNASQAYLHGVILECVARAYNAHGHAVDSHQVANEMYKASKMLKDNAVDAYIEYIRENQRFQGWWD